MKPIEMSDCKIPKDPPTTPQSPIDPELAKYLELLVHMIVRTNRLAGVALIISVISVAIAIAALVSH